MMASQGAEGSDTPPPPRVNFVTNDSDTRSVNSEHGDAPQPHLQPTLNKEDVLPEPPLKEVQFVPNFKGAAEMEARRRLRMMARRGPSASMPKVPVTMRSINPELSSSDGEDGMLEEDDNDDDFELLAAGDGNMDETDEFDPYGALYIARVKAYPLQ